MKDLYEMIKDYPTTSFFGFIFYLVGFHFCSLLETKKAMDLRFVLFCFWFYLLSSSIDCSGLVYAQGYSWLTSKNQAGLRFSVQQSISGILYEVTGPKISRTPSGSCSDVVHVEILSIWRVFFRWLVSKSIHLCLHLLAKQFPIVWYIYVLVPCYPWND